MFREEIQVREARGGEQAGPTGGGRWTEYEYGDSRRQNLSTVCAGGCLYVCVFFVLEKETEGEKGKPYNWALH